MRLQGAHQRARGASCDAGSRNGKKLHDLAQRFHAELPQANRARCAVPLGDYAAFDPELAQFDDLPMPNAPEVPTGAFRRMRVT